MFLGFLFSKTAQLIFNARVKYVVGRIFAAHDTRFDGILFFKLSLTKMNKSNIVGFAVAVLVLAGIIWIAQTKKQDNANVAPIVSGSGGLLTAEENNFDFGSISMAAGNVKHSFKIKNAGAAAATIGKMYTSCMCTTATLEARGEKFGPYGMPGHGFIPKLNKTVDPGEEAIVEVVFDPAAHGPAGVGRIQRVVTIEQEGGRSLELGFTATVTP